MNKKNVFDADLIVMSRDSIMTSPRSALRCHAMHVCLNELDRGRAVQTIEPHRFKTGEWVNFRRYDHIEFNIQ